jgi:hypothetical protein
MTPANDRRPVGHGPTAYGYDVLWTASCPQDFDNPSGCQHTHRRYDYRSIELKDTDNDTTTTDNPVLVITG